MKRLLITIFKYCGLFLLLIAIFNIAFYLVCLIDSDLMYGNVEKSSKILRKEGYYYQVSKVFDVKNDTYVDAETVNASYSMDNKTPYLSYMKIRRNYIRDFTHVEIPEGHGEGITVNYVYETNEEMFFNDAIGELEDFLAGKIHYSTNYGRYWHGYLVLLRPLLVFYDVLEIRTIAFLVYTILFLCLMYLLNKQFGRDIAFIFGASLICSGYFSSAYSLGDISIYLVMMVSSIILLKRIDKIKDFGIFIFAVGCITNFVDFLRVPLITLSVPCAIYILKLINDKKDWKYCVKTLIVSSILWVIAYALTWFSKWVLYDLTINDFNEMVKIGLGQALYRTGRINVARGANINYMSVVFRIIGKSAIYTGISALIVLILNKVEKISLKFNKNAIPFFILSLYPIVWYVVLANHTIMHDFFVYRLSLLFMLGVLLGLYQMFNFKEEQNEEVY